MSRKTRRRARSRVGAAMIVAALGGSAFGTGTAAAAPGAHASAAHCVVPGSETVIASRTVRVYRVRRKRFGCLLESGQTRLLDSYFRNEQADKIEVFQRVAVNGTWVVWTRNYSFRVADSAPEPPNGVRLRAEDLRTGRRVNADFGEGSLDGPLPRMLTVSRSGTIAWVVEDTAPSYGTSADLVVLPSVGGRPAVAMLDGDGVSLVRGRGDGTFSEPTLLVAKEPGHKWDELQAADLDGDGTSDLVIGAKGFLELVPGQADGSFAAPQALPGPRLTGRVKAGDLDRDGRTDIVVTNRLRIAVLRGLGGFAFSAPIVTETGGRYPRSPIADIDGDGTPDMLVAFDEYAGLAFMHGNGDGTFGASTTLIPDRDDQFLGITVADLNRDALPDVVCHNGNTGGTTVLIGRGGGTFAPPAAVGGKVAMLAAVADVTGEGNADIVGAAYVGNGGFRSFTLPGAGDGTFSIPEPFRTNSAPGVTRLIDVNSDGKLDIITAMTGLFPAGFTVLLGQGNGGFTRAFDGFDIRIKTASASAVRMLRRGVAVDARSLRFRGATLTWTTGGRKASARAR
jgi:hypothetical protein